MTGKEIILYILNNDLENAEFIIDTHQLLVAKKPTEYEQNGYITEKEAALKFNVGKETIRAWYFTGVLPGKYIGESLYILRNAKKPQ